MRNNVVKISILFVFCALFMAFGLKNKSVLANLGGPPTGRTGAPNELTCSTSDCHLGSPVNGGGGTLTISGFPATFSPNQDVDITITMAQSGRSRYGFQATIIDDQGRRAGTITNTESGRTQILQGVVGSNLRQYVEHTFNGTDVNPAGTNQGRWTFHWKAPAQGVGRITIYVAANAANDSGDQTGDLIYTRSASGQLIACAPITISPETVTNPTSGIPYNQTLTAAGTSGSVTYSINSGGLPTGLSLSPGGVISGTPTISGSFTFEVKVTDGNACVGLKTYTFTVVPSVATVSAASFAQGVSLAPETIVAGFGTGLSVNVVIATETPLPTQLDGSEVVVRDAGGVDRNAPLFFVAPSQINYLIPLGTANGAATISVRRSGVVVAQGTVQIESTSPGIFTANAGGTGVPAAVALRVVGTTQTFESIYSTQSGQPVATPINLGPVGNDVYLILYGTGIKGAAPGTVSATIGGTPTSILGFAAAPGFVGLDQINVGPIPRSLIGRETVNVVLTVGAKTANTVTINIQSQ
ncbi:MAG: choice-of-anchor V domain-containing protein [Acidobacteriota bacterium]